MEYRDVNLIERLANETPQAAVERLHGLRCDILAARITAQTIVGRELAAGGGEIPRHRACYVYALVDFISRVPSKIGLLERWIDKASGKETRI